MAATTNLLPPGVGAGAQADPFNPQDRYYVANQSTVPAKAINLRDKYSLPIYHQGQTNSCTANAATMAFWYEEVARGDGSWGTAGPSRNFVYWLARGGYDPNFGPAQDDGSWLRKAMYGISKCGACPEADHKFPDFSVGIQDQHDAVNAKPDTKAFDDAKPHAINSYYRLDADRPLSQDDSLDKAAKDKIGADTLQRLKSCLTEGFPVAFTFWFYLDDDHAWDTTSTPYLLNDPWITGQVQPHTFHRLGGHSVIAVGYDDSRGEEGQVLVQNSWGSGPGQWGNGLFWMPYSWVKDFYATVDFWTVRINKETAPSGDLIFWDEINKIIFEGNN